MLRFAATLFALSLTAAADSQDHNPLFPGADPDITAACDGWWIYPTSQGAIPRREFTSRFYAWHSRDMQHWTRSDNPILDIHAIKWIADDGAAEHYLWAPGITRVGKRYYLYYSVGPQNPTPSRIGVATADRPDGPFIDSGKPLLTGDASFEAIDPMVFTDPRSGRSYLYAGGSAGKKLRIFEMGKDMVSLGKEVAVTTPPQFTEGSFLHERNGIYYLSYSHGRFNGPDYSVHYATAPSPTGPFTYRGAILTSDASHQGPGHHAFFRDPKTGQWFIVYHRWDRTDATPPFSGMRDVAIDTIRYDAKGMIAPVRMTDGAPPVTPAPPERCS